jgi:hypothetical protein
MTVRYSINTLNVETRIEVLETIAGADVVEATKIFEREIGEEEIVCRIQSFILINTHHWVRQRLGYELFDRLYLLIIFPGLHVTTAKLDHGNMRRICDESEESCGKSHNAFGVEMKRACQMYSDRTKISWFPGGL